MRCEDDEVEYILKSLSYVFPGIAVRPEQIVYRYSGVRPLPRSEASFTGRISRDHFVAELPGAPATLCLVGGKWTTFRAFGAQAADRALEILRMLRTVRTENRQIGGGAGFPGDEAGRDAWVATLAAEFAISRARAAHAADHYGSHAGAVLAHCRAGNDRPIACSGYTESELRYLIRHEHARSPADLVQRRTSLAITGGLSSEAITQASAALADELGWTQQRAADEERAFRDLLARDHGLSESILTDRDRTNTRSPACV